MRSDEREYFRRCRLLLQRSIEVVEQLRVGDRDRRLFGEGLEHAGVVVVERSNLEAANFDVAEHRFLVAELHHHGAVDPIGLNELRVPGGKAVRPYRLPVFDEERCRPVADVDHRLPRHPSERHPDDVVRVAVGGDDHDVGALDPVYRRVLGVAQGHGPFHYAGQYGGKVAGVGADEAQYLARGGLQLEGFGELGVTPVDLAALLSGRDGVAGLHGEGL